MGKTGTGTGTGSSSTTSSSTSTTSLPKATLCYQQRNHNHQSLDLHVSFHFSSAPFNAKIYHVFYQCIYIMPFSSSQVRDQHHNHQAFQRGPCWRNKKKGLV